MMKAFCIANGTPTRVVVVVGGARYGPVRGEVIVGSQLTGTQVNVAPHGVLVAVPAAANTMLASATVAARTRALPKSPRMGLL
jgi:hypothetical protein